jgi:hypothetical protein
MPRSPIQPRLRASLLYLGSALFLTTGMVAIADQPIPPPGNKTYCSCNADNQQAGDACRGRTCTEWVSCHAVDCITIDKSPYLGCSC